MREVEEEEEEARSKNPKPIPTVFTTYRPQKILTILIPIELIFRQTKSIGIGLLTQIFFTAK